MIAWPPSVFTSLARCVFRGAVVVVVVACLSGLRLFLHVASGAVVINSVANPSPRELSGPPCVRVYTRSSVFREHPDARRFSRLCFSLVCEYRESSVCVNFTSACFLVDVGVAPSTPDRCSSS